MDWRFRFGTQVGIFGSGGGVRECASVCEGLTEPALMARVAAGVGVGWDLHGGAMVSVGRGNSLSINQTTWRLFIKMTPASQVYHKKAVYEKEQCSLIKTSTSAHKKLLTLFHLWMPCSFILSTWSTVTLICQQPSRTKRAWQCLGFSTR